MKKLILPALLLISTLSLGQTTGRNLLQAKVDVVYLSSDLLEGRASGSKGEQLAAEYISTRFEELGLSSVENSWYQMFPCGKSSNPHSTETNDDKNCNNVLAMIDHKAKHTVVIGAHYDHLGYGEEGSLDTDRTQIHNGADDNASGIAALLYLAKELQSEKYNGNNYLFIAFSGEEMGLLGSSFFVNNPLIDLETINYMFNMDMVGRLNTEKGLNIFGVGTSPIWKTTLKEVERSYSFITDDAGTGPSDHTSFYRKSIPVLHFFTGSHVDYHKSSDDAELINYNGILEVGDLMMDIIAALNDDGKLAFTATKEKESQKMSFKVSLGVIPDYVYDKGGMRVEGVLPNRPGSKAGMKDGDIIIKLGEIEVKDVYDYMAGLNAHKPGQKSTIVVKRGTEELTLNVEF